ncbi:MAG: abortive infection system antitoxin AbiGi family protein [Anaerolineae bacterium]
MCFCDIPEDGLDIHMRKYSRFGLALTKKFLVSKGASPVFYVAESARPALKGKTKAELADRLQKLLKIARDYSIEVKYVADSEDMVEVDGEGIRGVADAFDKLENLLDWEVLSYIKFFDPALDDQDQGNYYMEREWRIVGSLRFELSDLIRIIVPKDYEERLKGDLPEFDPKRIKAV